MTRSNRVLNRLIIAGAALVLLAAAAWVANAAWSVVVLPAVPAPDATSEWIAAAVCALLIVLAVAWIARRGRGRTRALLAHVDERGTASITARVAAELVEHDVREVDDVAGVSARAFRVRGRVALELRVSVRPHADLRHVVDRVGDAVAALDIVLEQSVPVVLHLGAAPRAAAQRVR